MAVFPEGASINIERAPLPDLGSIKSDLSKVVRYGVDAAPDTAALPILSSLLCVQQRTQGPNRLDTVMAIEGVIRQAVETLEGTPPYEVLQRLFGLTPATSGALAKHRRTEAANQAGTTRETFNRHDEQRLLRLLARRIYKLETDARVIEQRLGPQPDATELRASWLQRFVHYHRLQTTLQQLRLDLIAVLLTYSTHPDDTGQQDYLDASIWQYGRLLAAYDAFIRELGGTWVMPDPAADAEARTAVELVLWHAPFNERGRSWLRTTLDQVPSAELYPFALRLRDGPDGTELLGLWEQWLEDCHCEPDYPQLSCRPHQVIDQCDRYVLLVDDQWSKVRERYRELPSPSIDGC